jgi:pyridoxine 4-dehydrogenase
MTPQNESTNELNASRLVAVAARHCATIHQIVLAWILALSPVTLVISGTGSPAHLEENVAAGSITLTPQDLADLDSAGEELR